MEDDPKTNLDTTPDIQKTKKKSNKKKRIGLIVGLVCLVLLSGILIIWAVIKNQSSDSKPEAYVSPCTSHKEAYNKLYNKHAQYDSEEKIGQEALTEYDDLINKLVDQSDSSEDVSCMYMVSELYAKKREYNNALYFIDQAESLLGKYKDRPILNGLESQMAVGKFKSYLEYRFLELKEYPQEQQS